MKLISMDGDPAFEDAVRDHVRQYRVPCLSEVNGSATLRYEFVFRPDSRQAHYAAPRDLDNERRTRLIQCVRHSSGNESPSYPMRAQAAGSQGRVLLRLRYYAANQPPLAEVFAVEPQGVLAQAVRNWAEGYRMPCLEGPAVEVSLTFIYRFEGDSFGFKPLDLQQVLAATEGIKQQRLHWDTSTMGCPFDLIWQYRQPHLSNVIGELQTLHPARRPLLEWLANAKLNLPGKATAAIFGDTTRISVPCIEIDLKP